LFILIAIVLSINYNILKSSLKLTILIQIK